METFSIKISRADRRGNTLYCEWTPRNIELADQVMHAMTLDINGTVAATIADYEPSAAREMFAIIDQAFSGVYQLDPIYA